MRSLNRLKQTLEQAARVAAASDRPGRTNVVGRRNVKVVANIGQTDGVAVASSAQDAPIRQGERSNSTQ
jgi:hypothetical protein